MNIQNHLLKPEDVASTLSLAKSTVYKLLQVGDIPSIKIGRSVRVRPTDLDDFIEQQLNYSREVRYE